MNKETAHNLIKKTGEDYNRIAYHFASTRKYNWPNLTLLLKDVQKSDDFRFADLGCGGGRVYELVEDRVDYYGLDLSANLVEIAKKAYPKGRFIVGSVLKTPYENDFFDLVVSVATLHHIPGKQGRQEALDEVYRILKPGGKVIILNWYFWDEPKYLKLIFKEAIRILLGKSQLDLGDFYMPWKSAKKDVLAERYFHAWTARETRQRLLRAGFDDIKIPPRNETRPDGKKDPNLIAIALKPTK